MAMMRFPMSTDRAQIRLEMIATTLGVIIALTAEI